MSDTEENNNVPSYAKIKFIGTKAKAKFGSKAQKVIPVKDIVKFNKKPPKDKSDFKKSKIYTYLYQDDNCKDLKEYAVQIGGLYDTFEEANDERVAFLPLEESLIERYFKKTSHLSEDEQEKQREEKKKKKQIRKKTEEINKDNQKKILHDKMATLNSGISLNLKDEASSSKIPKSQDTIASESTNCEISSKANEQYKCLQEEIKNQKAAYLLLQEKYDSLQQKYDSLQLNYTELSEKLETLKSYNNKLIMTHETNDEPNNIDTKTNKISEEQDELSPPNSPIDKNMTNCHCSTPKLKSTKRKLENFLSDCEKSDEEQQINAQECDFPEVNHDSDSDAPFKKTKKRRLQQLCSDSENNPETETKEETMNKKKNVCKKKLGGKYKTVEIVFLPDTSTSGLSFLDKYTNEHNVKMVYIKHDISVPQSLWKNYLEAGTRSIFCKKMLRHVYPTNELKRRCLKEGPTVMTPNGKNQRVILSPKKSDAMAKACTAYMQLKENMKDKKIIEEEVKKITKYWREEMGNLKKYA